jgi:hypothetical protein
MTGAALWRRRGQTPGSPDDDYRLDRPSCRQIVDALRRAYAPDVQTTTPQTRASRAREGAVGADDDKPDARCRARRLGRPASNHPGAAVRDVRAAVAYYRDRFGFDVPHASDGLALLVRDEAPRVSPGRH